MRAYKIAGSIALALGAASCITSTDDAASRARTHEVLVASFEARGQATLDRLTQDETQALCSQYPNGVPDEVAAKIRDMNLKTVRYPADGKLLGDWKRGEKIAQTGRGLQFSDKPGTPAGGNCYACHQLSPQELSYGTMGPSLRNYGKRRGYGPEMQKYVYTKVYNSNAFFACSNMPRFGHNGILTEEQIKDVVALLMDPDSPVNQ